MKITMLVLFTPMLFYTSYLLFGRIIKDYRFEPTLVGEYFSEDQYGKKNGKLILYNNREFILEIDKYDYRKKGKWYYVGGAGYLRHIKLYNEGELIIGFRLEDYGLVYDSNLLFKPCEKGKRYCSKKCVKPNKIRY